MHPAIAEAAACLRQAREQGRPCAPVRDLIERAAAEQEAPALQQAYAVQQYNNAADIAAGWNPVGHKIGLTSSVVQRQLGWTSQTSVGCSRRWREVMASPFAGVTASSPRPRQRSPWFWSATCALSTTPWLTSSVPPPSRCQPSKSLGVVLPTGTSVCSIPSPTMRRPGCSCSAASRCPSGNWTWSIVACA